MILLKLATATTLLLFATSSASAIYVVGKRGSSERREDCQMQTGVCYKGCDGITEEKKCNDDCEKFFEACMAERDPKLGNVAPNGPVLEQVPASPRNLPTGSDLPTLTPAN
jgi:hypothetical protein